MRTASIPGAHTECDTASIPHYLKCVPHSAYRTFHIEYALPASKPFSARPAGEKMKTKKIATVKISDRDSTKPANAHT